MKSRMKRLVSGLLAVVMMLTTLGANTNVASAEERLMQSYVYDGYEVEFLVNSAWNGAFNADVKIANTGDSEICDWAFSVEFAHEIQNIWNAIVLEHNGNTYVIKNADWNANIKPGECVTFGMTVLCDGNISFPENFSFVMEEESVITQNYSAEFTLYSDWGTGCNGAIVLSNLTNESIENWQLEFDYGREIVNIANAVIVSREQNHYVIKNAEYNADIAGNSSVYISIVAGEGAADERPENFSMQQTVVGDSSTGEEGGSDEKPEDSDPPEAILLYVLGKYNAETQSIDMDWCTNATEPEVTVWTSEDNVTYEQEATVTGATNYQYVITEEFETKYFKASVVDMQGNTEETMPFVVVKNENGYSVSLHDSDNDGIADEYELLVGTDVNNPDTDGDTLTDYEELYISQTDATKYDSVTEGLSDAEADSDGDKLSNREEIDYTTDVQNADTDNDTLTDYEEIKVHNTDPLRADMDGDTLKDGDEIALGFDPLNPMTFGVPDAEYTVEQTISADSEALEEINTDENGYRLSVDVTASGYVEGNLTAKETGYAAAIQNEFMVGIASELSYANEDGIESVTLTFELDDEEIEDSLGLFPGVEELSGIKRFNVFKYFEELNMLLPIETVVDEENNRIYATTDELGTYCVMDMGLWLSSFEVPEEVYQEPPMMFSMRPEVSENETTDEKIIIDCIGTPQDMELVDFEAADEESVEEEALADAPMMFAIRRDVDKTPVDVVFLLQSSGQLENTFINQKTMIYELLDDLGAEYGRGNVRFAVISYNLSGAEFLTSSEGDIWFTTTYDLRRTLNNLEYEYTSGYTDRGTALQKLQSDVAFKENASKFIFQVMNGSTDVGNMYFDQISTCEKLGINYSELMPEGYAYIDPTYGQQVANAIASTNGMNATYGSASQLQVYKHIVAYAAPPQVEFEAFVPSGWKKVVLDGILDAENGVNSDTDDLTDWQEVNTELLSWDTDGTVVLPTIQDCIYMLDKPYAEAGVERYLQSKSSGMSLINFDRLIDYVQNSIHILPIYSDPTDADTDRDGLLDVNDPVPMSAKNYDPYGIFMNDEATVTLVQQCLVHLGYLDMKGNSYGTFGGLTSAAVQLYQVNHRSYKKNESLRIYDIEDRRQESGYSRLYLLDRISYYSIIREAVNCGFSVPYNNEFVMQSVEEAFSFFKQEYIPKSVPMDALKVSKNTPNLMYVEVVKSEKSKEYSPIYVYDLTIPLEGMLRRGAQEFHFYHYKCNPVNSWIEDNSADYVIYDNSSEKCVHEGRAFLWMFGQVSNGNRYDIKVEQSWCRFFNDLNLEVPYYHSAFPFVFNGEEINAEEFGNILYGFAGNAGGYSCVELVEGGSWYSFFTTGKFDDEIDSEKVAQGYSLYDEVKKDYYYLHITW